jgi:hypothetical protein
MRAVKEGKTFEIALGHIQAEIILCLLLFRASH